jgi:hypothetical protein
MTPVLPYSKAEMVKAESRKDPAPSVGYPNFSFQQ